MNAAATLIEIRAHELLPRDVILEDGRIPITVTGTHKRPCEMLSVQYESIVAPGWRQYHLTTPLTVHRPELLEKAH